jgi:serine protease Do
MSKTVKKLFTLFVFVLLATHTSSLIAQKSTASKNKTKSRPTAMTLPGAIEKLRPSIVQIRRYQPPGFLPRTQPIGTGFVVSQDGHVITAAHVVAKHVLNHVEKFPALGPNGEQLKDKAGNPIFFDFVLKVEDLRVAFQLPDTENMRGATTGVKLKVVEMDEAHDVALLKVEGLPASSGYVVSGKEIKLKIAPAKLYEGRPTDGSQIAVSGYPLAQLILVTNSGAVASSWAFDQPIIQRGGPLVKRDIYLGDLRINRGNSGGPVYLVETGEVIGVCSVERPGIGSTDQLAYNSGLAQIAPNKYVIELLKKNKVSY